MKNLFALALSTLVLVSNGQNPPKLTIVLVVDQMRSDFLFKYEPLFGTNGFRSIIDYGFVFRNAHYSYAPTYTGPGHACISTGSVPALNGIIANDWYDRTSNGMTYCVSDPNVKGIGSNSKAGNMSPRNLLSSTLGNELKLSYPESKSIAIALKDRSAILSSGHYSDGTYWYCDESGNFITSSHYQNQLPNWLNEFNQLRLPEKYIKLGWELLLPLNKYSMVVLPDNNPFEGKLPGSSTPTLPWRSTSWSPQKGFGWVKNIPAGNTLTFDLAKATILGEKLGLRNSSDLLFISLSSTDIIGHTFGIHSLELADTYARLDKDIMEFISFLNHSLGSGNWQLVLTADHAAAENPNYLKQMGGNAGIISNEFIKKGLNELSISLLGTEIVESVCNLQVYINPKKIIDFEKYNATIREFRSWLISQNFTLSVLNSEQLLNSNHSLPWISKIARGFMEIRCGNLFIIPKPGWLEMEWQSTGTTHGSIYNYDTHVPLIFYGAKIKPGHSNQTVFIEDIAPTLALILKCSLPSASIGTPLSLPLD
jgi:hypothetical protein